MVYQGKTDWQHDEVVTEQDLNRIEGGIAEAQVKAEEHTKRTDNPHCVTADQVGAIPLIAKGASNGVATLDVNQRLTDAQIPERLNDLNKYASKPDENGQYTLLEYKRADGTLFMKSTASNPDENLNYQMIIWEYFDATGTNKIKTQTWTLAYDEDNKIVSEVMV